MRTQYCLVNGDGCTVHEGCVPTEDVVTLVDQTGMVVVLEATDQWCAACNQLVARGAEVKLAHPTRMKTIDCARVKTDRINVRILAHPLRADSIPQAWTPPGETHDLRDLVQLRWGFIPNRRKPRIASICYWLGTLSVTRAATCLDQRAGPG